jgi:glutamate-1-semialdehyde 2,1-aminomutase
MDFDENDYGELQAKLLDAARKMKSDGWWVDEQEEPGRNRRMRMLLVRELASSVVRVPLPLREFGREVLQRKADDHEASHHSRVNQVLHLVSSSVFIYCYFAILTDVTRAMWLGLPALFVRQIGHAVFEPPCHDKEASLLGFDTRSKTAIVAVYLAIPLVHLWLGGSADTAALAPAIAWHWLLFTLFVVLGRVGYLVWRHGLRSSLVWFVKLATDPFSDLAAYAPFRPRRA